MKAVMFEEFGARPKIATLPDPDPDPKGAVIEVGATGVCRSDWHGWMGHDPDIILPHVPGHELAGRVAAIGRDVTRWKVGDRVTVPFVGGCGACPECHAGHQQVCHNQFQPGFTHWGSFAQYVAIAQADLNLVALPETMSYETAASLGCRFATAFRAVVDQGRTRAGEWLAVHGCGGVGLSALMIARAIGTNTIAIDISDDKLSQAEACGATHTLNATKTEDVVEAVRDISGGGVHVSLDALGHPTTFFNSITNLRKRGRHVQVGLLLADHATPAAPMSKVIGNELEILGSHGMQAHRYDAMLAMIQSGLLSPEKLIGARIALEASIDALTEMNSFASVGATVITEF
jgi:alcohol dehydrogenase